MTGRGLQMVGAISSSWGVDPASSGRGKVVWAELGGVASRLEPDLHLDALLTGWPDEEIEQTYTVRLGRVPTALLLDAKEHIGNVVRELTLERAGSDAGSLPPAFGRLIQTVTQDFAAARAAIKRQAIAAAARGDAETDLVLMLPASAADAGERYLAALAEADRHSRAARLLTLEPPHLHQTFRRFYVGALVEQLRALAAGRRAPRPQPFVSVLCDEVSSLASLRRPPTG